MVTLREKGSLSSDYQPFQLARSSQSYIQNLISVCFRLKNQWHGMGRSSQRLLTREKRLIADFKRCNPLGNCTYHDQVKVGRGKILEEKDIQYIKDTTSGKTRIIRQSDPEFQKWLDIFPPERRKRSLPARSIDLVCETSKEIWILEAKVSLNQEAIGQVLQDNDLYQKERKPTKPLKLGIICEESDPYLEETCQRRSITIFEKTVDCFRILG